MLKVFTIKFCAKILSIFEGETCCGEEFNTYSQLIKSQLENDVYIKAVQIGGSVNSDRVRSMTMHPFDQVNLTHFPIKLLHDISYLQIRLVCDIIKTDEKFQGGYNGMGFSQGAIFL